MYQRLLSLLVLASFWTASSGLALALHHHTESQHHETQKCSICHDLLTSSQALASASPAVFPGWCVPEHEIVTNAQRPAITDVNPAVSPRAPPFPV